MKPASFDRLAAARRKTLELVEGVDQESAERRPEKARKLLGEAGTWSIAEILDHILRAFRSLAGEIETLYELDAKGEPTNLKRSVRDYDVAPPLIPRSMMPILEPGFRLLNAISGKVVSNAMRERILRNRSVPIQNPTKWLPVAGRDIGELRSELQSTMRDLEKLLERETRKPLEELILSHTVFGTHSVPSVLGVLEVHETWHHEDIENLLKEEAGDERSKGTEERVREIA